MEIKPCLTDLGVHLRDDRSNYNYNDAIPPPRNRLKSFFSRKRYQSSRHSESSGTLRPGSSPATSISNPSNDDVENAAAQQAELASRLQAKATLVKKARWLGQKKQFIKHIDEIQASNDIIRDIVSLRTLGSIHNILVIPEFKGKIPENVLMVQASLQRLHHALKHANQGSQEDKPVDISIRVLEAATYLQLRKRIAAQHNYLEFWDESILYPLQIRSPDSQRSTLVLAEVKMKSRQSSTPRIASDMVIPVSTMLKGESADEYEAFKEIGSVVESREPSDAHRLFEDISTSWTLQNTLAALIRSTAKFRTYVNLATQIAMSYVYFASIGLTHGFPKLDNYRYYRPLAMGKQILGPEDVLEPYLTVGFGSRAPRQSTMDIGGAIDRVSGDEAMTHLGILLHEVGCWRIVDEEHLERAKETAKNQRQDLQLAAGISYTQVVDVCFAAKEGEWAQATCATNIYRRIVAPLEQIVSELRWE